MEEQIRRLHTAIKNDPAWSVVVTSLNLDLLKNRLLQVSQLTHGFIYTTDYSNKSMIDSMWYSLMSINDEVFRMYDRSGYSSLMSKYIPELLYDFSFSDSKEFQDIETQSLSHINIPEKIWKKIWTNVDNNKSVLNIMQQQKIPFTLQDVFNFRESVLKGAGALGPMSQYNFGNVVMAGIGSALGITNGILFAPSSGVSGASFFASIVLTAISAGRRD